MMCVVLMRKTRGAAPSQGYGGAADSDGGAFAIVATLFKIYQERGGNIYRARVELATKVRVAGAVATTDPYL
jgi:hypothetical protein